MTDVAIKAECLGKKYLIGHNSAGSERNITFRETVSKSVKDLARKSRDMLRGEQIVQGDTVEEFWALKHINFEIKKGDTVGIIGRNGAGKSTLLKILSRITEPSEGRIFINGRVSSLLEVGTGFHAELTGRENIYLNGAILGMSRNEIKRKFDQIVEFAEIEKFLDTPVKRYSSGMYVRLAFSVAAHLEPEILIVDEVLAVGDLAFQKKCLGKLESVSSDGRTVLFVSHDINAIRNLCRTGVLLKNGRICNFGTTDKVCAAYLEEAISISSTKFENEFAEIVAGAKGGDTYTEVGGGNVVAQQPWTITLKLNIKRKVKSKYVISIDVHSLDGKWALLYRSNFERPLIDLAIGEAEIVLSMEKCLLTPGVYNLSVWISENDSNVVLYAKEFTSFSVISSTEEGGYFSHPDHCRIFQRANWFVKS